MNQIFKIVFNAASGKMMVVNEATSSVQTGKKAAVTVAVIGALASGMAAACEPSDLDGGSIYCTCSNLIVNGTEAEPVKFENIENIDGWDSGAAIWMREYTSMSIDHASFTNNSALYDGGAIKISAAVQGNLLNSTFSNNTAKANGGAVISSGKDLTFTNNVFTSNAAGYLSEKIASTVLTSIVEEGISDLASLKEVWPNLGMGVSLGGAVHNNGTLSIAGSNEFISNNAGSAPNAFVTTFGEDVAELFISYGGAIANVGTGNLKFDKNSTNSFTQNTATNGGAIYNGFQKDPAGDNPNVNKPVLTFDGVNTFVGNAAGELGGAIYNDTCGTITFNGTNTFSGNTANGVRNDIHNDGTINVTGGTLTLDGGITGTGTITFADGTTLVARVTDSDANSTKIANDVTNNGATLQFVFDPGFSGQYQLVTGTLDKEFTLESTNSLFNVAATDKNGTYTVTALNSNEIQASTGATDNQAEAIVAVITEKAPESAPAAFKEVSQQISDALQSKDPALMEQALAAVSAMSPTDAPVVQYVQTSTANQVLSAVGQRFGAPKGKASGDVFAEQGLWVQGMFNKGELDDTAKIAGFDSDTYGFAMGFDGKVNDNVSVGFGYSFAQTDVDADLRSTDVDTHTVFAYGEYQPCNWFVNGIVSYAWSDYEENNAVMSQTLNAQYDVETFGMQVMTGYDFQVSNFQVTPEIGVRYFHTTQDRYTDSFGTSVTADDTDIFTAVAGINVATTMTVGSGVVLTPEFHVAATYDMKQAEAGAFVMLVNGSSYHVDGEDLDRFGMEVGAKVTAEVTDNLEVSASYEANFRDDFASHTGLIKATYKF